MAQTYATHVRYVPRYLIALFVLIVHAAWSWYDFAADVSLAAARSAAVASALVLIALYARSFALRAQDRVIRLEMRLRLRELLPPDLRTRIQEFTTDQLVALRFASDRELPALAVRVLDEGIRERKVIKPLVKEWQEDDLRV